LRLVVPAPIEPAPKVAKPAKSAMPPGPRTQAGHGASVPWFGLAVTGTFAAGATMFGVFALGASNELQQLQRMGAPRMDRESQSAETMRFAVVSDVFSGVAVVAGGISLYQTIRSGSLGAKMDRAAPGIHASVMPGVIMLHGRF